MFDTIVVGSGLFGSVISLALHKEGRNVFVIDDKRPDSGSKPAACLMRPSWLSKLGKDVYNPALKLLDELYGVHDIKFQTAVAPVTVHWCDPKKILGGPNRVAGVRRVAGGNHATVFLANGEELEARNVVIAAGIWSGLLGPPIYGKFIGQAGMACLWPDEEIEKPFVKVWMPYKQITAFNRGDGLWVGDSNSIQWGNWGDKHAEATERRCKDAVGLKKKPTQIFGVRPYSSVSPCYLKEAARNVWIATGGAKNGTVAAAWCAHQLRQKL